MQNLESRLLAVKQAARHLRVASKQQKDSVLESLAHLLDVRQEELLEANRLDLEAAGSDKSAPKAFLDRLAFTPARIGQMIESLKQVAALPDPVGESTESKTLKNGLVVTRVRSPLGVIFMIFESRPNVAVEAFSLAFKAGNGIILRGGKESMGTTKVLYDFIQQALQKVGLPQDGLWGITDADRAIPEWLLKQNQSIDVVVPRGGSGLIEFVEKNTRIPIIKNDRGVCHVYVHEDADPEMAMRIVVNAKTQRPGVCNAMETLLVHSAQAKQFLPQLYDRMSPVHVEWHACPHTKVILAGRSNLMPATPESWDTEYLDLKMNCRVVDSVEEAMEHIDRHGSHHSEAIVTKSKKVAELFQSEIDAAAVYWNASTRFTDGFQLGLGGELGISTQKLHVRGPVGLRELTSVRWVISGNGQVREN